MIKFEKVSFEQWKKDFEHMDYPIAYRKEVYDDLTMPKRTTIKSAGYDFCAPHSFTIEPGEIKWIYTGFKVYMNPNMFLGIYPRSGLGAKHGIVLANTVCIVDADYVDNQDNEGHIIIPLKNTSNKIFVFHRNDRFAQGIFQNVFHCRERRCSPDENSFWRFWFNRKVRSLIMTNDEMMLYAKKAVARWCWDNHPELGIATDDVFIVWFSKTLQNWKTICSFHPKIDGNSVIAEVTYNGDQLEAYVDVYIKEFNGVYTFNYGKVKPKTELKRAV